MGLSKAASVVLLLLAVSGCAGTAKKKTLQRADAFIEAAERDLAAARTSQADKFASDSFQRAQVDFQTALSARKEQRGDDAIHAAEDASRFARVARVAADNARAAAASTKPVTPQPVPMKKVSVKKKAR